MSLETGFVQKYNITDAAIQAMKSEYMPLKVSGIEDKEGYETVRAARLVVKTKRCEVEKTRQELKEESIRYGRAVDAEAKRITALLVPIEEYLQSQEKIIDDEKKRIDKEKADKEIARVQLLVDELFKYGVVVNFQMVQEMTPEQYKERLDKAINDHNNKLVKEKAEMEAKKAEQERLDKIKAEQEAENTRLMVIRKEQEAKEAAIKAEQQKIIDQQKAIEDQKRKEAEEKVRKEEIEKAQKVAAEKAVKDAEEKARIEKVEAERKEKERIAEERRLEEIRPDKEKLLAFAHTLELIEPPILKDPKAVSITKDIRQSIKEICNKIRIRTETL